MKDIRIYSNIDPSWKEGALTLADFFPIKILQTVCRTVEEVSEDEDLFIHAAHFDIADMMKRTSTKLVVSGEPLFYRFNLLAYLIFLANRLRLPITYLPITYSFCCKYIPSFILNIQRSHTRPKYVKLLAEMQQGKHQDTYAVICNDTQADHIFNIPYFIIQLDTITNGFKGFTKKKKITKIPKKFCCAVVSNAMCVERNDFYKALSKYKKIDIYGKHFLNNADNNKIAAFSSFDNHLLYKDYKFVICFENSYTNEYITNKLVEPMMANTLPVYRGAPNTGDYFNTKAFINYDDYGNYQKMIDKIIELDNDDEKYKTFLETPYMTEQNMQYINNKKQGLKDFLVRIVDRL